MPDWVLPAYAGISVLFLLWAVSRSITAAEAHITEHLDRQTKHLEGVIKMADQNTINELTAQLNKAKAEIVAAGTPVDLDLSGLVAVAQELDDLNPDASE
jgi:hypothetical protein